MIKESTKIDFPVPLFVLENIHIDDYEAITASQEHRKRYNHYYDIISICNNNYNSNTIVPLLKKYKEKVFDIIIKDIKEYYCFEESIIIIQNLNDPKTITQTPEEINELTQDFLNLKEYLCTYFEMYGDHIYPNCHKIFQEFDRIRNVFYKYTPYIKSHMLHETYKNLMILMIAKIKNNGANIIDYAQNHHIFYTVEEINNYMCNFLYKNFGILLYETNCLTKADCSLNTRIVYRLREFYLGYGNKEMVLSFIGLINKLLKEIKVCNKPMLEVNDFNPIISATDKFTNTNYKKNKIDELVVEIMNKQKELKKREQNEINTIRNHLNMTAQEKRDQLNRLDLMMETKK